MNKSIILWLSAFFITLLVGYAENVTDSEFPISGSIGINGKKVSYYFERVQRDSSDYQIIISTDQDSISGVVLYAKDKNFSNVDTSYLKNDGTYLIGTIPFPGVLEKCHFRVELNYKNETYIIPTNDGTEILFYGKVPTAMEVLYFIVFFVGLLLSSRTGLEYFNPKPHTKKLALFTIIPFALLFFFVSPVYKTFELNLVGSQFARPQDMFTIDVISYFLVWTLGCIIIFNVKNGKLWGLISSILTIILILILK